MARLWWTHVVALFVLAEVLAHVALDVGTNTSRGTWALTLLAVVLLVAFWALIQALEATRKGRAAWAVWRVRMSGAGYAYAAGLTRRQARRAARRLRWNDENTFDAWAHKEES